MNDSVFFFFLLLLLFFICRCGFFLLIACSYYHNDVDTNFAVIILKQLRDAIYINFEVILLNKLTDTIITSLCNHDLLCPINSKLLKANMDTCNSSFLNHTLKRRYVS